MSSTPVTLRNGRVITHFTDTGDPLIKDYQVLATVLWTNKQAQLFQVHRQVVLGGSNTTSILFYNRKKGILTPTTPIPWRARSKTSHSSNVAR